MGRNFILLIALSAVGDPPRVSAGGSTETIRSPFDKAAVLPQDK